MTEKEKLIARINELGVQLNREVSTSGTIQELTMRVAELEEELDGDAVSVGGESGEQNASDSTDSTGSTGSTDSTDSTDSTTDDIADAEKAKAKVATTGDRVSVKTLATLHIEAWHATRNEPVSITEPGVIIRVSEKDADELIDKGLAHEV